MTQTVHSCDDVKMQWRGLYAIADTGLIGSDLMDRVAQAIQGGASVVQYRSKEPDPLCCSEEARALLALCRRHGVPLIINDDVALAEIVGSYLPWLVVKGAACGCWRLPLCRLVCLPDC